jgi:WD40 repeat protein
MMKSLAVVMLVGLPIFAGGQHYWQIPKLGKTLEGHTGNVWSLRFSPDGRMIASGGMDNTIKLWETSTGKLRATLQNDAAVSSVAFGCDGKLLASSSFGETSIKFWDLTTGQQKTAFSGHTDTVFCVAFNNDATLHASGSWDGTIKIWDTMTGVERLTLKGHLGYVPSVAFSHNGKLLASGSNDTAIKLWDPTTGQEKTTLYGHGDDVFALNHRARFSCTIKLVSF